jgi:DNA helicase-2/ATP-dependent DNA helicase PcrA
VPTPLPRFGQLGAYDEDEFEGLAPEVPAETGDTRTDDPGGPDGPDGAGRSEASPRRHRPRWLDDLPDPESLLQGLNGPQARAVEHRGSPLLVVAGAGSGKTRVLTHRVAHLIASGDATPFQILAITFTNKAAGEMRERLTGLVGPVAEKMWVSTFHAACVRILRANADRLGYRKSFTIYDDTDSRRLIEQIMRERNIDTKKIPPRGVQSAISGAKAELMSADAYQSAAYSVFERRIGEVYVEYQQRLQAASAADFDDLLVLVVRLFREHPDVLESYRKRFLHVLVDEYQDTNRAQNEIVLLLAGEHHNVCVVGDSDQCLPPGSLIATPDGDRRIEDVAAGDVVLGTGGGSGTVPGVVAHRRRTSYAGPMVRVTAAGRTITGTPHHIVFATPECGPGKHLVYLMRRIDRGFRVGRCKSVRTDGSGKQVPGYMVRLVQEHGDMLWVLKVCDTLEEAAYWEAWFAATYGLPTACFHAVGRSLAMGDEWLERLYREVDTGIGAKRLMEDLALHPDFPHFRPQNGNRRQTVSLTMFGGNQGSRPSHRVAWSSNRADLAERLADEGFNVRAGKLPGTHRLETSRTDYRAAVALARSVASAGGLDVRRRARIDGVTYDCMPLSHLHPGMTVLVQEDGTLRQARVEAVVVDDYEGDVFDLEVEGIHSYVASGILTHNSIYGFRRADIRNILEFEEAFPDAAVIPLEQNYRSTQTILDAANAVIANNVTRVPKELFTEGDVGERIRRFRAEDEYDEADWITTEIRRLHRAEGLRYGDIALFFRTNAQSRALEDALMRAEVPYRVVGGTRFYERREVKDIVAYLRVLANPADEISLRRIVNVPRRGVGDASVEKLASWARQHDMSFAAALAFSDEAGVSGKAAKGVAGLRGLLDDLRRMQEAGSGPGELVVTVAERTGYVAELEAEDTVEARGRIENVAELASGAARFESLDEFLESVALVSDSDELDGDDSRVSLMTLHTAKGLEFPAVFLVGLEDGIFPHLRALDDPMQLEEERRLCYVGITRARRHLYLSYAWSRTQWGTTSHAIPSRFLSELPEHLVEDVGPTGGRPDPLRAVPSWARRRHGSGRYGRDDEFAQNDPEDLGFEAAEHADDGHDPDPWRDEAPSPAPAPRPRTPPPPRRAPSGPKRLPKMAEWKFGNR